MNEVEMKHRMVNVTKSDHPALLHMAQLVNKALI